MRVVVIMEPGAPGEPTERGEVASALADLGARVTLGRFDLTGLDLEPGSDLVRRPPAALVIEAGDDVPLAHATVTRVRAHPALAHVPILVAATLPRLPALDFSLGFTDFVLLPLVPAELYARLRQLDWRAATFDSDEVLKLGDLVIDVPGYEVRIAGRRLELTHQEFDLLRFLAQNRGRVFTRDSLLEHAWGYRYAGGSRTVDIHVRRVRSKLGVRGDLIETVRNVGYKMRA